LEPDFIPVRRLAELTGFKPKSLYNQHSSGVGPLAEILTRLGSKVGAWRPDYEAFVATQRRLPPPV
jgi:hypothetical protein